MTAYIITGPTSGYGYRTALELAKHGTVVLVGRDANKLARVQREIGGDTRVVLCDMAELASVKKAAAEIIALQLPIAGLVNNAGVMDLRATRVDGIDKSFATNHLGPFSLTEALIPHLPDGATIVFVVSAVEDPDRKQAKMAGFRGGRYISAEASARGEWLPGGAKNTAYDAYATSKQCNLATVLAFARETPRLKFIAVEPGFSPGTGLGRDANIVLRFLSKTLFALLVPLIKGSSTPKRAARVIANAVVNSTGASNVYLDERGQPMRGSTQVNDTAFQDRVVAETRALLRSV